MNDLELPGRRVAQSSSLKEVVNHKVSSRDKTRSTHHDVTWGSIFPPPPPALLPGPVGALTPGLLPPLSQKCQGNAEFPNYLFSFRFLYFILYVLYAHMFVCVLCTPRNWSYGQLRATTQVLGVQAVYILWKSKCS